MAVVRGVGRRGDVQVIGLRELQLSLRAAEGRMPKELKRAFDEIGREILVPEIQERIEQTLVGESTGALLGSVRARSQQRAGQIYEGKASIPYAGWWEFGGSTHSPRGGGQREIVKGGRAMYPALVAKREEIRKACEDMLNRISAGL